MATQAEDPRATVTAAKIAAYGTVGVALIGTIGTVVTMMISHDAGNAVATTTSTTTISHPTANPPSSQGSVDKVEINGAGTEVTVTGSAAKDVDSVAILVGPRESGGQFWANVGSVSNQQWQLTVATDPHIPEPYTIEARYHSAGRAAVTETAFKVTFQATEPTTPPPSPRNQIVNCAEQYGPNCFDSPGWGPPSVYQSK
jgi:hypothetical protein